MIKHAGKKAEKGQASCTLCRKKYLTEAVLQNGFCGAKYIGGWHTNV